MSPFKKSFTRIFSVIGLMSTLGCNAALATEAELTEIDPANLFQTMNYAELAYEYQQLNIAGVKGGLNILRFEYDTSLFPNSLLVVEGGIGYSDVDRLQGSSIDGSGLVDTRLRYFDIAWPNKNTGNGFQGLGYTIEVYLPTGDIAKSTGADQWIIAPGLIANYQLNEEIRIFPILSLLATTPTNDFEDFTGINKSTSAVSTDVYVTTNDGKGFYTLLHAGYQFGVNNRDDSAYAQARVGWMLSETLTIGVEGLYNYAEDASGSWNTPELGPEWTVRFFIGTYAF